MAHEEALNRALGAAPRLVSAHELERERQKGADDEAGRNRIKEQQRAHAHAMFRRTLAQGGANHAG